MNADLWRSFKFYSDVFWGHTNVRYIGLGTKARGGIFLKKVSLIFFVEEKIRDLQRGKLPKSLPLIGADKKPLKYRIATDIVLAERDEIKTSALDGGDTIIGHATAELGTLGVVLNTAKLGVTNSHVVAGIDQIAIGSEVSGISSDGVQKVVASVLNHSRLSVNKINTMDLAILHTLVDVNSAMLDMFPDDEILGWNSLEEGLGNPTMDALFYSSQGVVVYCGRPVRISKVEIRAGNGTILTFSGCFKMPVLPGSPAPQGGHSGSLLVSRQPGGFFARGLVFAASPSSVWAFSYEDVRRQIKQWGYL